MTSASSMSRALPGFCNTTTRCRSFSSLLLSVVSPITVSLLYCRQRHRSSAITLSTTLSVELFSASLLSVHLLIFSCLRSMLISRQGCPSWSWYYPYHYAPFVSDLRDFADHPVVFEESEVWQHDLDDDQEGDGFSFRLVLTILCFLLLTCTLFSHSLPSSLTLPLFLLPFIPPFLLPSTPLFLLSLLSACTAVHPISAVDERASRCEPLQYTATVLVTHSRFVNIYIGRDRRENF